MSRPKSFYIFDFDDNIIHTGENTYVYIYHKETGQELALSTREYFHARSDLGLRGDYIDYQLDFEPMRSFRNFADSPEHDHFPFLDDIKLALQHDGWQGPSWHRFVKAVDRQRTMSIITARGHHPENIREGIHWLFKEGHLPREPQIHSIYAVTHPETRKQLKWTGPELIASLKKQALHHFIETVYNDFGHEPAHRFGFSDDDPKNISSTRHKFLDLKERNPHHRFFLYEARPKEVREEEVLLSQNDMLKG